MKEIIEYRDVYAPLSKLPVVAALKQNGSVKYLTPANYRTSNIFKIFSTMAKEYQMQGILPPDTTFNVDILIEKMRIELNPYYLHINPRNITTGLPWSSDAMSETYTSLFYDLREVRLNGITYKHKLADISDFTPPEGINPTLPIIIGAFASVNEFLSQCVDIFSRGLSRAVQQIGLYENIPKVNEQFTDEVTITPNLTTTHWDRFDPLGNLGTADRHRDETTSKGSQTTVSKRSANVDAFRQAEIIRNLPNIFTDVIAEIKTLLVDPRTINDMRDWGLAENDYIVEVM